MVHGQYISPLQHNLSLLYCEDIRLIYLNVVVYIVFYCAKHGKRQFILLCSLPWEKKIEIFHMTFFNNLRRKPN